jgi:hypothetical protein
MDSEFEKIRFALRQPEWIIDNTPLIQIELSLLFGIRREIRRRLRRGEPVSVLFLGAGARPRALRKLAKLFGRDIAEGRLRLAATHLTRKDEWRAYAGSHSDIPATFHRATLPMLVKAGVKADIIVDRRGPIFFANDQKSAIEQAKLLLNPKGILAYRRRNRLPSRFRNRVQE